MRLKHQVTVSNWLVPIICGFVLWGCNWFGLLNDKPAPDRKKHVQSETKEREWGKEVKNIYEGMKEDDLIRLFGKPDYEMSLTGGKKLISYYSLSLLAETMFRTTRVTNIVFGLEITVSNGVVTGWSPVYGEVSPQSSPDNEQK